MALRSDLIISAPAPELVARLSALAKIAVDVFWQNPQSSDVAAHTAVHSIQSLTGNPNYDAFYFHSLMGSESIEDFAQRAALGTPPSVPDLARDEIIDAIERIAAVSKPFSGYYLALLERSFPHTSISGLIYWSDRERTSEEMADEILHRKRLYDAGGAHAVRLHILALANAVVADPASPIWAKQWAEGVLGAAVIAMPPQ
jgi:hypothetical protein